MSRPRRDPRTERAGQGVGGGARPRFDLATSPAPRRPRRDPRREHAALLVPGGARPRLDRAHAGFAAPVSNAAPAARALPAAPKPVLVEDAALRVLVVADPGDGPLSVHDRQVMAAARLLAGPAGGIVLAADRAVPDAAATGADRVVCLSASAHPADRFEAVAALLASLDLPHVVLPESPDGADLARRLAARTGRSFLAGVEQVSARGLVRPVPGRRVDQEAREAPGIATVAVDRVAPRAGDPPREARPVEVLLPLPAREARRRDPPRGSQALHEADFVVSAGNGIRDVSRFLEVAKALGGTAGASRVLCDAGLMPRAAQVGASGTVLAADCYLALGIAGAPQHLQGISGCRHVLAVNTDLHAAMVERAELAIVADAAPVMDALLRLLAEEQA